MAGKVMARPNSFGKKFMALVFGASGKPPRKFTIDRYVVANASVSDEKKNLLKRLDGKVFFDDELKSFLLQRNFTEAEADDLQHFAEKYVSRSMDSPEQILWIPRALLWVFALYAVFYWVVGDLYSRRLLNLINEELQPEHPATLFQVALGLSFTFMGFATFLWAVIGYPIQQALICYKNDYVNNTAKFKEQFFSPIPRKIMSLGVIPMIFAICGIIFFKEDQLLDTLAYFTLSAEHHLGMDPLKLLLLCGGMAECSAFFLGYLFPENSPHRQEGVSPEETKPAPVPTNTTILDIHEPVTVVANRNLLTDDQLKRLLSSLRVNLKVDLKE